MNVRTICSWDCPIPRVEYTDTEMAVNGRQSGIAWERYRRVSRIPCDIGTVARIYCRPALLLAMQVQYVRWPLSTLELLYTGSGKNRTACLPLIALIERPDFTVRVTILQINCARGSARMTRSRHILGNI